MRTNIERTKLNIEKTFEALEKENAERLDDFCEESYQNLEEFKNAINDLSTEKAKELLIQAINLLDKYMPHNAFKEYKGHQNKEKIVNYLESQNL